jgi:hypothetical protein
MDCRKLSDLKLSCTNYTNKVYHDLESYCTDDLQLWLIALFLTKNIDNNE